ncbi:16S rRNA (cytidine(1402)-2'-O)-methyltransferase [Elongatibacter sediminis]|uniref:Ribosomal RNA small subunit methyltransferase I n=1 Tax=Elongatibacter sediminis TaxID=3119006 RepID=A0AAW9RFT1_9GAMM
MPSGELFIVATPIGNLADLTHRADRVLREADVVVAEDTRRTRVLLAHYGIDRTLLAMHEHNEEAMAPQLVKRLRDGESIALVSDAGTPLVSDPGYRLVRTAIDAGIAVRPVPGPSALMAAISAAGLPTDRFVFEGFLPSRQAARRAALERLQHESRTLVFFESSHRALSCLADLEAAFGSERYAAVCRELTKQFETVLRGPLGELRALVAGNAQQQKGEFVFVVAGAEPDGDVQMERALELGRVLQNHLSGSQAARVAARFFGVSRRDLYQLLDAGSGD